METEVETEMETEMEMEKEMKMETEMEMQTHSQCRVAPSTSALKVAVPFEFNYHSDSTQTSNSRH